MTACLFYFVYPLNIILAHFIISIRFSKFSSQLNIIFFLYIDSHEKAVQFGEVKLLRHIIACIINNGVILHEMGFHACRCCCCCLYIIKKLQRNMCGLNVRLVALLLPIFYVYNFFCWSDGLSTQCRKQNHKETSCAGCSWKIYFCILILALELKLKL